VRKKSAESGLTKEKGCVNKNMDSNATFQEVLKFQGVALKPKEKMVATHPNNEANIFECYILFKEGGWKLRGKDKDYWRAYSKAMQSLEDDKIPYRSLECYEASYGDFNKKSNFPKEEFMLTNTQVIEMLEKLQDQVNDYLSEVNECSGNDCSNGIFDIFNLVIEDLKERK
jgi:hypothetical protein